MDFRSLRMASAWSRVMPSGMLMVTDSAFTDSLFTVSAFVGLDEGGVLEGTALAGAESCFDGAWLGEFGEALCANATAPHNSPAKTNLPTLLPLTSSKYSSMPHPPL